MQDLDMRLKGDRYALHKKIKMIIKKFLYIGK